MQEASYTDFEQLATLLQHVRLRRRNAGTILLDALVERPARGLRPLRRGRAARASSHAALNVTGEHYERARRVERVRPRAGSFGEVVDGIERALAQPDELADERRRVASEVVGEVDGRAGERVVDAIVETVRSS